MSDMDKIGKMLDVRFQEQRQHIKTDNQAIHAQSCERLNGHLKEHEDIRSLWRGRWEKAVGVIIVLITGASMTWLGAAIWASVKASE